MRPAASTRCHDSVIWFRGELAATQSTRPTKPFWQTLEGGRKRSPRNLASPDAKELDRAMLAEKFLLIVESLIRAQGQTYRDGSQRVVSTSPHIPVPLPAGNGK